MAHTYADTACKSDADNMLPPIGGIAPMCCLGVATPSAIVLLSELRLPSPHSHWPAVKSAPTPLPLPSDPWQPAQVPLRALPWNILSPRASCSVDTPGGGASATGCSPASGCTPSGGPAAGPECVASAVGTAFADATFAGPGPW